MGEQHTHSLTHSLTHTQPEHPPCKSDFLRLTLQQRSEFHFPVSAAHGRHGDGEWDGDDHRDVATTWACAVRVTYVIHETYICTVQGTCMCSKGEVSLHNQSQKRSMLLMLIVCLSSQSLALTYLPLALTCSPTYPLIPSLPHSLTHSPTHSLTVWVLARVPPQWRGSDAADRTPLIEEPARGVVRRCWQG